MGDQALHRELQAVIYGEMGVGEALSNVASRLAALPIELHAEGLRPALAGALIVDPRGAVEWILRELIPVVFLDGKPESEGYGSQQGSSESWSGGRSEADVRGEWAGMLKPGEKLKIGLAPPMPASDVSFVIDRSSITKPQAP